jgi:universal stress protein A
LGVTVIWADSGDKCGLNIRRFNFFQSTATGRKPDTRIDKSLRRKNMVAIEGILAATDFSQESTLAIKFAVSLAQEYKTKLYLLHVFDPLPQYYYLLEDYRKKRKDKLKEELPRVIPDRLKETVDVEEILEEGLPVHHFIVEKAKELGVDLIVLATHGRTGLAHVLLGSVAEPVIRHAPCPVFVVRNPQDKYPYEWE